MKCEIDVGSSEKLRKAGEIAFKSRDYNMACECFQNAIALHPTNAIAWYDLAILVGQHGKMYSEAKRCLEKAILIDPEFGQAWKNLVLRRI